MLLDSVLKDQETIAERLTEINAEQPYQGLAEDYWEVDRDVYGEVNGDSTEVAYWDGYIEVDWECTENIIRRTFTE